MQTVNICLICIVTTYYITPAELNFLKYQFKCLLNELTFNQYSLASYVHSQELCAYDMSTEIQLNV